MFKPKEVYKEVIIRELAFEDKPTVDLRLFQKKHPVGIFLLKSMLWSQVLATKQSVE